MLAHPKLGFDKYSHYHRQISEVHKVDKEGAVAVSHCLKQKIQTMGEDDLPLLLLVCNITAAVCSVFSVAVLRLPIYYLSLLLCVRGCS